MPSSAKYGLVGVIAAVCVAAAYLMIARGPALLLDLGNALVACF